MEFIGLIIKNEQFLFVVFLTIGALSFFLGTLLGKMGNKVKYLQSEESQKNIKIKFSEENRLRRSLQNELNGITQQNQKYLSMFVNLPEAVKRLCSNLTHEEVSSSIVRLVYQLIGGGEIALFLYDPDQKKLKLSLAYGLDKQKHAGLSYAVGEGKIGVTAEARVVLNADDFKSNPEIRGKIPRDRDPLQIDFCAPIRFKERLHGVLSVGKIKNPDPNHRTFLSMIADLAAISLDNLIRLDDAQLTARVDPLTGLYNRRYFEERLMEEGWKCKNYSFACSIFLFDIDHFKSYNDQNGHPAGDQLLKDLSQMVRTQTRGTDILTRYGGEEFIVLLSARNKGEAMQYADGIRKLIETHKFPHMEKQPMGFLSISGGVASFPDDGQSLNEIIQKADKALYMAKEAGRNRVIPFPTPSLS